MPAEESFASRYFRQTIINLALIIHYHATRPSEICEYCPAAHEDVDFDPDMPPLEDGSFLEPARGGSHIGA
jgi:hypothetical protein